MKQLTWAVYCTTFFFSTVGSAVMIIAKIPQTGLQLIVAVLYMACSCAGILWLGFLLPAIHWNDLEKIRKVYDQYVHARKKYEEALRRISMDDNTSNTSN